MLRVVGLYGYRFGVSVCYKIAASDDRANLAFTRSFHFGSIGLINVTPNDLSMNMWKKIFCFALVLLNLSATVVQVAAAKKVDETDGVFGKLQAQYDELSPKGKFVTGAAVGFVGSRLALGNRFWLTASVRPST